MSPDEIKAKAATLAELYAAKAAGKTLQVESYGVWNDQPDGAGPTMSSVLSRWRVKPEPRRMWEIERKNASSTWIVKDESEAIEWRESGHTVTEWQEVLP